MTVALIAVVPMVRDHVPTIVVRTIERLSTIGNPEEDVNASWRMECWKQAAAYGLSHPILGAGFGPPLEVDLGYRVEHDVDPHNSFVAILFRLGLPGLFGFLWFYFSTIRGVTTTREMSTQWRFLTGVALSANVAAAVFAFFNVALEGPYMGIPFWVSLALVYQLSLQSNALVRVRN